MSLLLESSGLLEPLRDRLDAGMPAFGTCAGMILLAAEIVDGRPDQHRFGAIDIGVRRNAFGRQVDSFETDLAVAGLDGPLHAVFIRAPVVEWVGAERGGAGPRDRHRRAVPAGACAGRDRCWSPRSTPSCRATCGCTLVPGVRPASSRRCPAEPSQEEA